MISQQHLDIKYKQNISKNVGTNILALIVNSLVGLLLVPFFLDSLGPAAYALIPLATSLTSYVTLFIDIFNAAISRYLTIELQTGDIKKANETYSTAYVIIMGFIALLTPVILFLAYLAPHIFETGQIADAEIMLFFALILESILVSTLKSNFMVILFAHNRLDLRNIVSITQTVTQVLLIVLLFWIQGPTLPSVGIAYMTAAVISLIIAYAFAKNQTLALKFSLSSFKASRIRELSTLSFFILFDRFGCILQSQMALIIINIYYGAVMQADYSLVLTWGGFLTVLAGVVTTTISPKIYSLTGLNDDKGVIDITGLFTKITGLFIALPISLLCIFSAQVLTLWVGSAYVTLVPLVWLLLPIYYFTIVLSCQVPIAISHNKMQVPAVLNIVIGFLYLGMALLFPILFNNGYYGVAIAYVITIFLHHGILSPIYYIYVVKGPLFGFIKKSIPGIVAMLVLMGAGYLYTQIISVHSLTLLILSCVVISVLYLLAIIKLVLSKPEVSLIKTCLPEFIQKLKVIEWL